MKNKLLMIIPALLLVSCGVVKPEAESSTSEETHPDDIIIVGITDKRLENPYVYENSMDEFYNSEVFQQSYENFFMINIYEEGVKCSTWWGFDSIEETYSGSIYGENKNGISIITANVTYPVFDSNLTEKYSFYCLVLNIQEKTIYSEPFIRLGSLEIGGDCSVSISKEITSAFVESGEIFKYYKYSEAEVCFSGDRFELESYELHEYDSNDNLIKSVPGTINEDGYVTYTTSNECDHVIMEKTGYKYHYNWDTEGLDKTPTVLWESFNRDVYQNKTSFFVKDGDDCKRIKLNIEFGSEQE